MKQQYYECHITLTGNTTVIEAHVKAIGWTFSKIDGDPVLGAGVKCYATKQVNAVKNELQNVILAVKASANTLREWGVKVLREKVELVVYDERFPS